MTLQQEIDKVRGEIRTDGYSVSIGEWLSIYEKNELDIHPDVTPKAVPGFMSVR